MNIEVIILIVCAVITLIVGLALAPTVVLTPFGILMIAISFLFAVTALRLYQNNESHAVTDGQVKAAYSECSSLKGSKWYDRNLNCLNLENDYVKLRNDNMPSF